MPTETEAKFIVPDRSAFDRLSRITRYGHYTARESRSMEVRDRYLDTPDRRFLHRGFAVRIRESDEKLLLTLKGLGNANGAVHTRDEYQADVPGIEIGAWPEGEARRLASEIAGDSPLTDLVTVDQARIVRNLYDGERLVAEWSLDDVTIPKPDAPLRFYELEVELRPDGTPDDLARLAELFTGKYGLEPQPESKFERARNISPSRGDIFAPAKPKKANKQRPPAVLPTDSMATAGRKLLLVQFDAMCKHEDAARDGVDPTAVHRMRVATRRMRALIELTGDYLPAREVKRVRPGLRELAHALGAVRDRDVLLGNAYACRAVLPEDQQHDLDGLLAAWNADRERANNTLLGLLEGKAYPRLKKRLRALLDTSDDAPDTGVDTTGDVKPHQVRHVVGGAIWTRYEAVRAYETVMASPTLLQLHALRITGKYLRYTLEFFRAVLPEDAGALIKDVTTMQDQLGALHDADVAASEILDYLSPGKSKRKAHVPPPGLAAYLADRQEAAAAVHADFAGTWARISDPAWRGRLAAVTAAL